MPTAPSPNDFARLQDEAAHKGVEITLKLNPKTKELRLEAHKNKTLIEYERVRKAPDTPTAAAKRLYSRFKRDGAL